MSFRHIQNFAGLFESIVHVGLFRQLFLLYKRDWRILSICIFLFRYRALFKHQIKHQISTILAFFDIFIGRIGVGCFYHPSQNCAFGKCQFASAFVKVYIRCIFDTVGIAPKVDSVEVYFQNLLFGKCFFQFKRQQHFVYLALNCLLIVQMSVFD